jgi:hypothetical protein
MCLLRFRSLLGGQRNVDVPHFAVALGPPSELHIVHLRGLVPLCVGQYLESPRPVSQPAIPTIRGATEEQPLLERPSLLASRDRCVADSLTIVLMFVFRAHS